MAMEAMAHRNRWFTELKNGDFPVRYVTNNQRVYCSVISIKPTGAYVCWLHSPLMPYKYQPPFRGAPPAPQFFPAFAAEFSEET